MRFSLTVSLFLFAVLSSAVIAQPLDIGRAFHVDCDSGLTTISQVLERARSGDTLLVRGACTETVTIDKSITLDGGGTASLAPGTPSDRTITVRATNVTIRGLTLEAPALFQIAASSGASATIESNTIRNAANFGVSAATNSFLVLYGNTIMNNGVGGVISLSGSTVRIGVRFFTDTPVPNLIADNVGFGVAVISNSTAQILGGNTISGNNIGIAVADGGQARIAGNEITGNQIGIFSDDNATVQLPLAANPNPLLTTLNSGVNAQLGIACKGGSIAGVPDGLAPAVRLPPTPGVLLGPVDGLATYCFDQTEPAP